MTIQEAEDILVEAPLTSNERRAVNALRNRIKALETLIDGAAAGFDTPGAPPYVKEGVRFLREGLGEEYAKKLENYMEDDLGMTLAKRYSER